MMTVVNLIIKVGRFKDEVGLPPPRSASVSNNTGCGRLAIENTARAFWQSRMVSAGDAVPLPPQLADLEAIGRQIHSHRLALLENAA